MIWKLYRFSVHLTIFPTCMYNHNIWSSAQVADERPLLLFGQCIFMSRSFSTLGKTSNLSLAQIINFEKLSYQHLKFHYKLISCLFKILCDEWSRHGWMPTFFFIISIIITINIIIAAAAYFYCLPFLLTLKIYIIYESFKKKKKQA